MSKTVTLVLSPKQASDKDIYLPIAAARAGIPYGQLSHTQILKRSVDARKGVKVNLTIELYADGEEMPAPVSFDYPDVSGRDEVVIVGCGPAGLFAALRLIELGFRPVILERGKDVSRRKRDIALINRNENLDPDSNYAYGEGGAGTFSDGKLFTRSKKRGDTHRTLEILVFHGADPEILYEAQPHIGTDKLPGIMAAIRKTITDCGGEILFDRRVTGLILSGDRINGVLCGDEKIEGKAVVMATGHSASDIYEMLHTAGVELEAKPFAMGVRIEHPQELIDKIQYHGADRQYLPAAAYTLTAQSGGRGVYSFCMCPGGFIVPAMTEATGCVVNGMSASARNSRWANSAIVTEVRESDFSHLKGEHGVLAGLRLRQQFEQAARQNGGSEQHAPAQRLTDFMTRRQSSSLPDSSYVPGGIPSRMDQWMFPFIAKSLREGFMAFDRKMHGFITDEALLVGVESRTSSPVRIPRDPESLMHPRIAGLYPSGEGAGYSGGIISSAVDGERVAEAIARNKA